MFRVVSRKRAGWLVRNTHSVASATCSDSRAIACRASAPCCPVRLIRIDGLLKLAQVLFASRRCGVGPAGPACGMFRHQAALSGDRLVNFFSVWSISPKRNRISGHR